MREHLINPTVREIWKSFPLRILGQSTSSCCSVPTLLVQSMDGGFVTRNCSACGEKSTLPEHVSMNRLDIWVACLECKRRMEPARLPFSNYGYLCQGCDLGIKLADLLPRWADIV
jgi:hypothetical protein